MTRKEEIMDRQRFAELLDAYGADFRRWPAGVRASASAFVAEDAEAATLVADAHELDLLLDAGRHEAPVSPDLTARILASAPRAQPPAFDRRAMFALAACAVFGVLLGYGGGLLAPIPSEDDTYFTMAFEAPMAFEDEG